jgi:hypothetical protein
MVLQAFLKLPTDIADAPTAAVPRARATYRGLLGEDAWFRLDPAIRARFDGHRPERAFYGLMTTVRLSVMGHALALLVRAIGSALCPQDGRDMATLIAVGGDGAWERRYLLPEGRAFTVRSVKRFDPDHGLLECLGRGVVMHLALDAERDALHFTSTGYGWMAGRFHLPLPKALWPGVTRVTHRELGGGRFRFTLAIHHPWLGEIAFQEGDFFEREGRP